MTLIHEALSPNVRDAVARARAQGDPLARFGVGGGCTPRTNIPPNTGISCPPPPELPGCIRPGRTCDVSRVGATEVVAGGSVFHIEIEPDKVPWFQPLGVRAVITDLDNTDLSHRVLFTSVRINDVPQESINEQAPVAPVNPGDSIKGWWSDDWIDPDGYAVPVGWGWISNAANLNVLTVTGIALGIPQSTSLLVSISLYGNGQGGHPPGLTPKQAAQPRV